MTMPKRQPLIQGQDYFCAACVGRGRVYCPQCIGGCLECKGRGTVECPGCGGDRSAVKRPEWL